MKEKGGRSEGRSKERMIEEGRERGGRVREGEGRGH